MIPFPEEAALAVASSVTPTALAAAASPSRLAASMSLTSAPPPSPEVARSQGFAAGAAFVAFAGADVSSPDSSSSSESRDVALAQHVREGGWLAGAAPAAADDAGCVAGARELSTLPGLDPSRLDVPLSTSTTLETILAARGGRSGAGAGGRRELGGGDRSLSTGSRWF